MKCLMLLFFLLMHTALWGCLFVCLFFPFGTADKPVQYSSGPLPQPHMNTVSLEIRADNSLSQSARHLSPSFLLLVIMNFHGVLVL